eukprot:99053-Karenia_brevis.AAC.1
MSDPRKLSGLLKVGCRMLYPQYKLLMPFALSSPGVTVIPMARHSRCFIQIKRGNSKLRCPILQL